MDPLWFTPKPSRGIDLVLSPGGAVEAEDASLFNGPSVHQTRGAGDVRVPARHIGVFEYELLRLD